MQRKVKSTRRFHISRINNLSLARALKDLDEAVDKLNNAIVTVPYDLNPKISRRDMIAAETEEELAKKKVIAKEREALYFAAVDFRNATNFLVNKLKNEDSLPRYDANIEETVKAANKFITNVTETLNQPNEKNIVETQNAATLLLGNFALLQKDLKKQDWEYYLGSVLMLLGTGLTVIAAPTVPIFGLGVALAALGGGLLILGSCLTFGKTITERRIATMDESALAMQKKTEKASFAKMFLPAKQLNSQIAEQTYNNPKPKKPRQGQK